MKNGPGGKKRIKRRTAVALDQSIRDEAWKQILWYLDTTFQGKTDEESAKSFFETVDIDKSGEVDSEELSQSFRALGILMDDRQTMVFKEGLPGGSKSGF